MNIRRAIAPITLGVLIAALPVWAGKAPGPRRNPLAPGARPNILFVVMDDVGIDQMQVFGYDQDDQPATPNIATLAGAGLRFRNTWAMPACSTSRAVFFTGRFPFRTNVLDALGPNDLANSMVSPYETTTPKLLAKRGYESGLFGKFHLTLPGNDPAGIAAPRNLGWSYFAGWMDPTGDPSSIDQTAGGVAPAGISYPCGFVPSAKQTGGADSGACYQPDGSCSVLGTSSTGAPPGQTCRDQGGLLVPNGACQSPPPASLLFGNYNSHFVSPVVYNTPTSVTSLTTDDPSSRTFRAQFAVDAAVSWINARPAGRPWMASVTFASDHTPLVQPPANGTPPGNATIGDYDCGNTDAQRAISNLLIESLDSQLARLLVQIGLATQNADGSLSYQPENTDTMVIVVGDNGSLGTTVKQPFDPNRAKGTAYQTGVWVPLVISGPLVNMPNRDVPQMVNVADLYALFGEIAGIADVQREARPRKIDAEPMLPYLVNPTQPSIRRWNFTQVGANIQVDGALNAPCTIGNSCTQIPVSQKVCEDNNGVWWGMGFNDPSTQCNTSSPDCTPVPPSGYTDCCQVIAFQTSNGETAATITPLDAIGIRDDQYKVVQNTYKPYVSQAQPCGPKTTFIEFYEINEATPTPLLDEDGTDLLQSGQGLTVEQLETYTALTARLEVLLKSQPYCPGDGNSDLVVDRKDLRDWAHFANSSGASSVYDLNFDGVTGSLDHDLITSNLGLDCRVP